MRSGGRHSILARQSRAELLDVLLSHALKLQMSFELYSINNARSDLLPLEVLLHLVLLAGEHRLVVLHGGPPVLLLPAKLGVHLSLYSCRWIIVNYETSLWSL